MMANFYMEGIYLEIEAVVKRVQRYLRRGVLPKHVQAHLPYDRTEGSIRRDMRQMWLEGRLVRYGVDGSRRGYRLVSTLESWIERNLLIFLGRRRFGFLIDEIALLFGVEREVLCDYLVQMRERDVIVIDGEVVRLAGVQVYEYERAA